MPLFSAWLQYTHWAGLRVLRTPSWTFLSVRLGLPGRRCSLQMGGMFLFTEGLSFSQALQGFPTGVLGVCKCWMAVVPTCHCNSLGMS